ncbi:MAG TPA: tripartite tricarboxylate transporter TctB family protein [Candidatus Limnocylindria bacterium]|nr:tripartite tricarboxylate transporter TctB family protein [Candidatus Limnocylindria bacterium]
MPDVGRALKDVLAGGIFIVLGLGFAIGSLTTEIGTPLRMGPGYFPLILGGILVVLGALIVGKGFIAGEGEAIGAVDWRALIFITAALLFFGLTIRGIGVIGALFGAALLAAAARSETSPREALVIAIALTVISVVVFIVALQLRLPLIGTWIPV